MKLYILIFCAFFISSDAFNNFIPSQKELTYSWTADVKAGTYLPVRYASQFVLRGNIHIQFNNESLRVKITNLTHRLYNGIFDDSQGDKGQDLPVPEEVRDLENVFRIAYNNDGSVKEIVTQNKEKEFSRNMKKAMATILQLNSSIASKKYQRAESFVVQENSIYPHGKEIYTVFPHNDEKIEVHKLHHIENTEDISSYFVTNTKAAYCDVKGGGKSVASDSLKKYILSKENGSYIVKSISTTGSIAYYPFNARSDAYVIIVNQTFVLKEVSSIQQEYHIDEEHFEKSLAFRPFTEDEDELLYDETNGRNVEKFDELMSLVQNLLRDFPQYLSENHMTTQEPNIKRGQLINRVQRILSRFNYDRLGNLKMTLPENALNVFYNILPLIGSEASTFYIKQLIMYKVVDEEMAISLLQRIVDNIKPSIHLVQKLEDIIYLNHSFSWNVRKVALLSFGNVVQKSYAESVRNNSLQTTLENLQKPYEKYVDEYITQLRSSRDYYTQITYLQGLRNMKLPILAQRLVPAFNGEWWKNEHLRYLSISAAAAPLLASGPKKVIESFWPIFSNRNEALELRAFTYYLFIYSRPSISVLRNIFIYMLTETNDELYHLHYSFVTSLVQSIEPCHQQLRKNLAQVLKFSPPPRRGSSSINFFGYQDAHYGIGGGIQNYYLLGEGFRIYTVYITTQEHDLYEEEYAVYLKVVDGRHVNIGVLESIFYFISMEGSLSNEHHIEVSIAKRGQIINTYVFDKTNVHELAHLFHIFKENAFLLFDNFFSINYRRYYRSIIPTDLGVPAFFEFLMPEVHYNNMTIIKDTLGDDITYHVENKYLNWINYRHGLSFYNSIANVWQGVHRYHSFDSVLPFHFDISLNFKKQTARLQWKKHNDPQMNTAGIRTHVQQVVFIENEDTNISKKYIPEGSDMVVISPGKKFRHEYVLFEQDDKDAPYQFHASLFDSELYITPGYFKKRLLLFGDTSTKYFKSVLEHLISSWLNFYRILVLGSRPGSYGLIFKAEPNEKLVASGLDVAYRQQRYKQNTEFWNTYEVNLLLSVQDQEQNLTSWDIFGAVNFDDRRHFMNFTTECKRTVPGEKDWKVCASGYKKWKRKEVGGHISLTMGEHDNAKCSNHTRIDFSMVGRRSSDQIKGNHQSKDCQYVVPFSLPHYRSLQCWYSLSSLRHYTYEITFKNPIRSLTSTIQSWWDVFKGNFYSYYSRSFENSSLNNSTVKVDLVFPLEERQVEIDVTTTYKKSRFSGLPLKYVHLGPDSTTFFVAFLNMYNSGQIDRCVVNTNQITFNKLSKSEHMSNEWTKYYEANHGIHNFLFLKQISNNIALKVVNEDDNFSLEIVPNGDNYQIFSNGTAVELEEEYHEFGIHYFYTEHNGKLFMLYLEMSDVLIEYQSKGVTIDIIRKLNYTGACYIH